MGKPVFSAVTRRDALKVAAATGLGMALQSRLLAATAADPSALITRPIPSTGEKLPVIGVGTNSFSTSIRGELRNVLSRFAALGATMIDTAAGYGDSEQVIGDLLAELKLRDQLFLATKFASDGGMGFGSSAAAGARVAGKVSFERSLQRLKTDHIDLLYVHNMGGTDELMPQMIEWKQAKRIRYIGLSAASDNQHRMMVEQMKKHPVDVVEINYGLGGRAAERSVLPLAAERRIAVVANVPFGGRGGRTLQAVTGKPLPGWAAEIGCDSWAQVMLKYVISHPAVTCVISGSTKVSHIEDNQKAGRGVVPDAATRRRIEQYWDSLT